MEWGFDFLLECKRLYREKKKEKRKNIGEKSDTEERERERDHDIVFNMIIHTAI